MGKRKSPAGETSGAKSTCPEDNSAITAVPIPSIVRDPLKLEKLRSAIKCHKLTIELLSEAIGPEFAQVDAYGLLARMHAAAGDPVSESEAVAITVGWPVAWKYFEPIMNAVTDAMPHLVADRALLAYLNINRALAELLVGEVRKRFEAAHNIYAVQKGGVE